MLWKSRHDFHKLPTGGPHFKGKLRSEAFQLGF